MLLTVDLDRLRVERGQRVLDVGCGEGRHCFGAVARHAHVVGIDIDAATLRRAAGPLRARAAELGRLGAMIRGDAFCLPFRDAAFDRVICAEVMEHVHDYAAAARELARVTRPGGFTAVTVPTATSEHLYLRLGDEYFETPGGHIRIFRPRDLAYTLERAGFRTVGVGFAHGLHTPYWILRSLVGLARSEGNRLVGAYHHFLIRATGSPVMGWLEGLLNRVCPKSLVLYARRRATVRLGEAA